METELRHIPASDLLLHMGQPLTDDGSESREGLFRYAGSTVKALLKEEFAAYEKLKLSLYDGVLAGNRTIAELTRKKYPHADLQLCTKLMPCVLLDLLTRGKPLFIYGISCDEDSFALRQDAVKCSPKVRHGCRTIEANTLSIPRKITAGLSGSAPGLEKISAALQKSASSRRSPMPFGLKRRTRELNLKISVSLMRSAAGDLKFISRYNEETFFKGLSEPQSFFSPLADLSEKSVRMGFTALYAMAHFGVTERDVFTVEGVFGFTEGGVRSKDDIRRKAAAELSARIMQSDADDLADMADRMGARLLEIPLPPVNVNEPVTLARNCTLYAGLAQVGKAYMTAFTPLEITLVPDDPGPSYKAAKERARLMAQYDHALQLCQGILTLLTARKPQISSLKGYKQAQQLQQQLENEALK